MSEVGITDGSSVHLAIYSTDQVLHLYKYLAQRSLGDINFPGKLQGDLDESSWPSDAATLGNFSKIHSPTYLQIVNKLLIFEK